MCSLGGGDSDDLVDTTSTSSPDQPVVALLSPVGVPRVLQPPEGKVGGRIDSVSNHGDAVI